MTNLAGALVHVVRSTSLGLFHFAPIIPIRVVLFIHLCKKTCVVVIEINGEEEIS